MINIKLSNLTNQQYIITHNNDDDDDDDEQGYKCHCQLCLNIIDQQYKYLIYGFILPILWVYNLFVSIKYGYFDIIDVVIVSNEIEIDSGGGYGDGENDNVVDRICEFHLSKRNELIMNAVRSFGLIVCYGLVISCIVVKVK